MVFSKGTGYGIRALAYLARQTDLRLCGLQEIAAGANVPPEFLRKLLGELRRHRIVQSVKGIHGGYLLGRDPHNITLWDVFSALDQDPYLDECILCHSREETLSCPFCSEWKRIRDELVKHLNATTIADFAEYDVARDRTGALGYRSLHFERPRGRFKEMILTWIAIIASLLMGGASVLIFIFAVKRDYFKDIEEAKYQVFWSDVEESEGKVKEDNHNERKK